MVAGGSSPLTRSLLWAALALALVLAVGLAVWQRGAEPASPQIVPATAPPPALSYLPGFVLTDRDGRDFGLRDLVGSAWVADFIFTRCPGPCLKMSRQMEALGSRLPAGVARVSFTVDPEFDTPPVLAEYAERHHAPAEWHFLTGPRAALWDLSVTGFKLGVAPAGEGGPDGNAAADQGPIIHSTRFVLIDAEGGIRGYYDALEPAQIDRLVAEAHAVAGEP